MWTREYLQIVLAYADTICTKLLSWTLNSTPFQHYSDDNFLHLRIYSECLQKRMSVFHMSKDPDNWSS